MTGRRETIPRDKMTKEQRAVIREIESVTRSIAVHRDKIGEREQRRAELYAEGDRLGLNGRSLGEAAGVSDVAVDKALRKYGLR